jgi:molybdopterin/thiamine biosynthesis adenylyltransferase/ubiquitin-protein ligase
VITPPWWERHPGRLEDEIARLEATGWTVKLDDEIQAEEDRIVLHLREGRLEGLATARVVFPDVYPFTKPIVFSEGLNLPRHYNPVTGEVCLLADGSIHWEPTHTVAALLDEQFPELLRAVDLGGPVAASKGLEERAPEPARLYLSAGAMPESGIIIDFDWSTVSATGGTMELAYFPDSFATAQDGQLIPVVRGVVAVVRDREGGVVGEADARLLHPRMRRATIPWAALDAPPLDASVDELSAEIHRLGPRPSRAERTIKHQVDGRAYEVEVLAALYVDEIRHGQQAVDAVFIGRGPTRHTDLDGQGHRQAAIRTYRAGLQHLIERVPMLAGMSGSSVLQIGVGGVGAPAAHMLAQAQLGRLTLMDRDHVDPATTPRFPASIFEAGLAKAPLVAGRIRAQNPYTDVTGIVGVLGQIREGGSKRQDEELEELIANHDLVFDATAEFGLQYLLADTCRRLQKPYIAMWATEGAWGGAVARLHKTYGHTPCFVCLQTTLNQEGVLPPRDPAGGTLAPAGCGSLTFTGAGFDLAPIVAEGVRTVASTLMPDYPDLDWDLAVCALRDESGNARPPQWQTHAIACCGR